MKFHSESTMEIRNSTANSPPPQPQQNPSWASSSLPGHPRIYVGAQKRFPWFRGACWNLLRLSGNSRNTPDHPGTSWRLMYPGASWGLPDLPGTYLELHAAFRGASLNLAGRLEIPGAPQDLQGFPAAIFGFPAPPDTYCNLLGVLQTSRASWIPFKLLGVLWALLGLPRVSCRSLEPPGTAHSLLASLEPLGIPWPRGLPTPPSLLGACWFGLPWYILAGVAGSMLPPVRQTGCKRKCSRPVGPPWSANYVQIRMQNVCAHSCECAFFIPDSFVRNLLTPPEYQMWHTQPHITCRHLGQSTARHQHASTSFVCN